MDAHKTIKCLIWDLDNTLWTGTLLEKDKVEIASEVRGVIHELDLRGILQSVASKNDPERALAVLSDLGLGDFFLYPQIGWGAKSESVAAIGKSLNIGLDSIAFIDDQPYERAEVASAHPDVRTYDSTEAKWLLSRKEFSPASLTAEARQRRLLYLADVKRNGAEAKHQGPKDEFLQSLGMKLTIARATQLDIERAHELTERTSQLNTSGYVYSVSELEQLLESPDHLFLVCSFEDRFGSYGIVGLAIVEIGRSSWTIKLLLASCRVMSRGVGGMLLNYIVDAANRCGSFVVVEFIPNERNRMFLMTCRFAGFEQIGNRDEVVLLQHQGSVVLPNKYVELKPNVHIGLWLQRRLERIDVVTSSDLPDTHQRGRAAEVQ